MSTEDRAFLTYMFTVVLCLGAMVTCDIVKDTRKMHTCYELAQDKTLCDKKYFEKE